MDSSPNGQHQRALLCTSPEASILLLIIYAKIHSIVGLVSVKLRSFSRPYLIMSMALEDNHYQYVRSAHFMLCGCPASIGMPSWALAACSLLRSIHKTNLALPGRLVGVCSWRLYHRDRCFGSRRVLLLQSIYFFAINYCPSLIRSTPTDASYPKP